MAQWEELKCFFCETPLGYLYLRKMCEHCNATVICPTCMTKKVDIMAAARELRQKGGPHAGMPTPPLK